MPRSGTALFRWDYQTFDLDGPPWDVAGYILNGTFYQLSSDFGSDMQWGLAQVNVNAGDTFGFYIDAGDNKYGGAELTIRKFPNRPP